MIAPISGGGSTGAPRRGVVKNCTLLETVHETVQALTESLSIRTSSDTLEQPKSRSHCVMNSKLTSAWQCSVLRVRLNPKEPNPHDQEFKRSSSICTSIATHTLRSPHFHPPHNRALQHRIVGGWKLVHDPRYRLAYAAPPS